MKLYSGGLSLFSAKVRIALAEKEVAYDLEPVPFDRRLGYQPKHPEVVRINPKQQVPVFVDGDLELYDSTLILEYLEAAFPDPPLYPLDLRERATCRQHEAASDEVLFPNVLTLIREVFYKPEPGGRDEAAIETATTEIRTIYSRMNDHLSSRDFFCDFGFTVADIAYVLTVGFGAQLGVAPDPNLEHLQGWLARVGSRPTVAADMAEMQSYAASLP